MTPRNAWQPTATTETTETTETGALARQKGQVVLRLSLSKAGNGARLPSASDQARFMTIYRAVLIDHPEATASPR